MQKTIFDVPKMDCPSEESLVRMALGNAAGIKRLDFALSARRLTITHDIGWDPERYL